MTRAPTWTYQIALALRTLKSIPPEAVPKRSVVAGPERVGEQVGELRLLLEDEEAEVVGDQVGEGDRDQRVGEAGPQLRQRGRAADASRIPRTPSR